MNRSRSTLKLVGARYVGSFVSFAAIAYFAQTLGPGPLGSYFLFETVLALLVLASDFGVRDAVVKYLSEGENQGEYASAALILVTGPLMVISLSILLFRNYIDSYIGMSVAGLLVIALILKTYAHIFLKILEGELRVGSSALPQLSRQLVWAVVGAALMFYTGTEYALFYGVLSGYSVMLIFALSRKNTAFNVPSWDQIREIFDFSKFNVVARIGAYSHSWIDVAIIGFFTGATAVGYYEMAWRVTVIVMVVGRAVAKVIFPQMSQWNKDGRDRDMEQLLSDSILISMIVAIPATVGAIVIGDSILSLVFGSEFLAASTVLIILMIDKIIQSVHILYSNVLRALNQPSLVARGMIVGLSINILLNILLIQAYGIVGAAIATTIALLVSTIIHGFYLRKFLSVAVPAHELIWCTLSAMAMGAFLIAITRIFSVNSLSSLVITILLCGLMYLGTVMLNPPIRQIFKRHMFSGSDSL